MTHTTHYASYHRQCRVCLELYLLYRGFENCAECQVLYHTTPKKKKSTSTKFAVRRKQ